MNKPRKGYPRGGFRKLMIFSALLLSGFSALASHFMYGNITYEKVAPTAQNVNSVEFTVTQAFHIRELPTGAGIGSPYTEQIRLITGRHGATSTNNPVIVLTIEQIDLLDSFFLGTFTYVENYPVNFPSPVTAYFQDAGRLNKLQNNANGAYRVATTVQTNNTNDAPITNLNPVVYMLANQAAATYNLAPFVQDDSGPVTFSLTPNGQFGLGAVQPAGLSVSPAGVLTFNTVGKQAGQYYQTSITVTDAAGVQEHIDFLIRIISNNVKTTPPYYVYCPSPNVVSDPTCTPPNNSTVNGIAGTPLTFDVRARDMDQGDIVSIIQTAGPGTFSSASGNPATGQFTWANPTVGTHVVTFKATDLGGNAVFTNVVLNINSTTCGTPPAVTFTASNTPGGCALNIFYIGYSQPVTLSASVPSATAGPVTFTFFANGNQIGSSITDNSAPFAASVTAPNPAGSSSSITYTVKVTYGNNCTVFGGPGGNGITRKVVDARCGNKLTKVLVCHNTGSNSNPHHNICVSPNAVPAHVNNHGDCIGDCDDLHGHSRMSQSNEPVPVFDEDQAILVYPNPARTTVNLVYRDMESDYKSFSVTDINGRVVAMQEFTGDVRNGKIGIDVSRYAPGIYLLRVVNEAGTYVSRFIVE